MYGKKEHWMKPPWEVFEYAQLSIGWRMGGGEDYLIRWTEWFLQLHKEEQTAYIAHHPEPEGWFEFYHQSVTLGVNKQNKLFRRCWQLQQKYIEQQYALAVQHERAGNHQQAFIHLENAIVCKGLPDLENPDLLARYAVLKRHLAHEMALNPTIRASWKTLQETDARLQIEIHRDFSAEQYECIQTGMFFPSDSGRTWIKWFENDTLYIHRHWTEPCLFLVIFQRQEDQLYHMTEAWMNLDPAIPRPPTKPPKEPEWLLHELIGSLLAWGQWDF